MRLTQDLYEELNKEMIPDVNPVSVSAAEDLLDQGVLGSQEEVSDTAYLNPESEIVDEAVELPAPAEAMTFDPECEALIQHGFDEVVVNLKAFKDNSVKFILGKFKDRLGFIGKIKLEDINISSNGEIIEFTENFQPGRTYLITQEHALKG